MKLGTDAKVIRDRLVSILKPPIRPVMFVRILAHAGMAASRLHYYYDNLPCIPSPSPSYLLSHKVVAFINGIFRGKCNREDVKSVVISRFTISYWTMMTASVSWRKVQQIVDSGMGGGMEH